MKTGKRILSWCLCLILCIPFFSASVSHAASQADNIVVVANGERNLTDGNKYCDWFYGRRNWQQWCAIFVSWCANQAGVPTSVIPRTAGVGVMYNGIIKGGGVATQNPRAGDIVFYWSKDNNSWAHVGIMTSSTVSVQGNTAGIVCEVPQTNWYLLPHNSKNYNIVYVRPNYGETSVKVDSSEPVKPSSNISITATTKGADTITETSATLRGEVSSSGGKITECGMYIGTSKDNLTLLGSDKGLSTYGTPCYYSTSKYGYPLQAGTTYYYQVYAKVGTETKKGEVKSFKTIGVTPPPTPTPEPIAATYRARIDTSEERVGSGHKYCVYSVNPVTGKAIITEVQVYDSNGKAVAKLKPDTLVTADPNEKLSVMGSEDKLVYVESDSGSGYVWDAYLSTNLEASTSKPSTAKYQAQIGASEDLKAKHKYCSTVVDERTGKVLEFSVVAYYDESGKVSAELKPGTVVTVDPDKVMLAGDEEDKLIYVESDSGNGYVWDAYLSANTGNTKPSEEKPSVAPSTPAPEPESPSPAPVTPSPEPETSSSISVGSEPDPVPPKAPDIRLSASSVNQWDTVTVSWKEEPDTEYTLYYTFPESVQNIGGVTIATRGQTIELAPSNPYKFTNLNPGKYEVYVTADNKYGSAKSKELSFTVNKDSSVTVTTKGVDNITSTDAIVRGQVTTSGGKRASECGMYFGTSKDSLTKLGSDTINATNMPFYYGAKKYGRTLSPGTTYYYRAYAIVNGNTYWGEIKSFTTAR